MAIQAGLANSAYRNDGKPAEVVPRPEDNWAPLAMATARPPGHRRALDRVLDRLPGLEALEAGQEAHRGRRARHRRRPRHRPRRLGRRRSHRWRSSTTGPGRSTSEPLEGPRARSARSPACSSPTSTRTAGPTSSAVGPGGRVSAWRNASTRAAERSRSSPGSRSRSTPGTGEPAQAVDLDLDTWPDLVGLPDRRSRPASAWSRNAGTRFETRPLPLGPDGPEATPLVGLRRGRPRRRRLARPAPRPRRPAASDRPEPRERQPLAGGRPRRPLEDQLRPHADQLRGARGPALARRAGDQRPLRPHDPDGGLGQSVGPVVLGMGSNTSAPLLRVRWPDGVMQCELNVTADKTLTLAEQSRKTGSCPVLFTWNGTRFECLGDFLGGGGLGYLVAPGVYGQPDRDESVAIAPDQLKAGRRRLSPERRRADGRGRLSRQADPRRRRPPARRLLDPRRAVRPRRAQADRRDHRLVEDRSSRSRPPTTTGRDVTAEIRAWDRRTVDQFRLSKAGSATPRTTALILDFGDRLAGFPPDQKLVLCLAGWVEYPVLADQLRGLDRRGRPQAAGPRAAGAPTARGR